MEAVGFVITAIFGGASAGKSSSSTMPGVRFRDGVWDWFWEKNPVPRLRPRPTVRKLSIYINKKIERMESWQLLRYL